MMKNLPLEILLSFQKILEIYREQIRLGTPKISRSFTEQLLELLEAHPELIEGLKEPEDLERFSQPINIVLNGLFPSFLSTKEIKAVSVPFQDSIFAPSHKFSRILQDAGPDFELKVWDPEPGQEYIRACILILNLHYGYQIEYGRPLYYEIPDKDGMLRQYSINHDTVFGSIEATGASKQISEEDVDNLVQHMDDLELWKEYFPPRSWIFRGFNVMSLTDVTQVEAISHLKSTLLSKSTTYMEDLQRLEVVFRAIYGIPDLKMGYLFYNLEKERFERMEKGVSFLLGEDMHAAAGDIFSKQAYELIMEQKEVLVLSNWKTFYQLAHAEDKLATNLSQVNAGSVLLAPIARQNRLLGVLELVSPRKNELNRINATRLADIIPYMYSAIERRVAENENRVKAVIQSQCTSIHPSVLWVFEKEARRFIEEEDSDGIASFGEIVFDNVHPLYGQTDIVASSEIRNQSIQQDLLRQLDMLRDLMRDAEYAQAVHINNRLEIHSRELQEDLDASSEQKVHYFLDTQVNPILEQLANEHPDLAPKIKAYYEELHPETGLIYDLREDYDQSVQLVNRSMARYLDRQQQEAQHIFPHYFERYKTDGVDHNIYIGASLSNIKEPFDQTHLYAVRLWQLRTICEMENKFNRLQEDLPLHLEVASLILVFNSTISIRYRLDEKRFDVDGTYNARYEIIKKRIDKACIKDSEERVVQPGKIAIVYSLEDHQQEYLRYIHYLQQRNYLGESIELLDLEEVQGVTGLKAIRVEVVYKTESLGESVNITYQDLVENDF